MLGLFGDRAKGGTMAVKLYVGGLSYSTTSEGLRAEFAQCGTVESATVITDRYSGQSRGFGFVEMATSEDAQNAISKLNGKNLDGRTITVQPANPQGAGGAGRGGPGRPGPGGGGPRRTPRW
jgi:RNA recognition motif-containing protein